METIETVAERVTDVVTAAPHLEHGAIHESERELRSFLADSFALHMKTKSFPLHMQGRQFTKSLRPACGIIGRFNDVATNGLVEVWVDEAERRKWFLLATLGGEK